MRVAVIIAAGLTLAACAGSPTEKRWGCSIPKGAFKSCASIAEIDARSRPQPLQPDGGVTLRTLTGAHPADLAPASGEDAAGAPQREADAVLAITIAPWIDAAGDYHARSDIYAVVRRGGWTVPVPPPPPPPPEEAAP